MEPSHIIKSRDNQLLRLARAVRDRRESELIFIEGIRLAEEAINSSLTIEALIFTEELLKSDRGTKLVNQLKKVATRIGIVNESIMDSISDAKTPQGIVVLAKRPDTSQRALDQYIQNSIPLIVILHGINNPSNAGSILRTAEAAHATGIITTVGSTDIFSPKGLRGAMGSSFRLPCWTGASTLELTNWIKRHNIHLISAEPRAANSYTEIDWTIPVALVLGEEGRGLAKEDSISTDIQINIPMKTPVESLNVSVASAILLYEAARQRGKL
jgi:RNA methyltransferase, TrmH family